MNKNSGETLHILVIGAGSIGRRHAANLTKLGVKISLFDISHDLIKRVCNEGAYTPVHDITDSLRKNNYDAAVICTPNHLHIPYAQQVAEDNINLFIEKPLSHTYDGVEILLKKVKEKGLIAMAGFNLRYEPGLSYLKNILNPSEIAFAQIEYGSYLPGWRPGVDYRTVYSANKSMGGGIIFDDVHEIDYACWLFGYPESVSCNYGRFGNLDINVEDTAELNLRYPDKIVTIHADYLQRKYTRKCRICLKDGYLLEWVFGDHVTEIRDNGENTYSYKDTFETNDMYIAEMKAFIQCLKEKCEPDSDLKNAAEILKIALKAKGGVS